MVFWIFEIHAGVMKCFQGEGGVKRKPRCGAKTRRGTPCQASAIWSTRSLLAVNPLPEPRRIEHGAEDGRGIERIRKGRDEARQLLEAAKGERA